MRFFDKYKERIKGFNNPYNLRLDSISRFSGKHKTPLLKYKTETKLLKPGGIYSFEYNDKDSIHKFNKKESLFYDKNPLVLMLSNDYNYGINLNLLSTADRLKLFSMLHDYGNYSSNDKSDYKKFKPILIDKNKVDNYLRINNVPYHKYDLKNASNVHLLDSSELVHIVDLYSTKIN